MNPDSVFLKVKDYSVSGETFELIKNPEFGFLETTPKPVLDKLPQYYESEDYISHTDAKRNLFEKAYHLVRSISLNQKLRLIRSFKLEGKSILDVGCGTGEFLLKAQQKDWVVLGIEPNEQARQIANQKISGLAFDVDELQNLNPNSFDVITLWHVLEHVPDLDHQISLFKKLLKSNGVLIIAVPNYKSFDAQHYKQFWAAYDAPRHLWHFDRTSISKLFSQQNMHVVKTIPMWFDAFYVSLLSEKIKSGSMNILKAFSVAIVSNLKSIHTKEASSLIYILKND